MHQRTFNAECVNNEGKKSWHMSDGVNGVTVDGLEYSGLFAAWDWVQVPGTTEWMGGVASKSCSGVTKKGTTTLVNGVSTGLYGAAAMHVRTGAWRCWDAAAWS